MHYLRNQKDINTYMGIFRTNNEKSDNRHGGGKKTARIVTRLFLVIVFLLLILVCYNLIVGSNDSPRSMMEEEEEMRDNVLKDTFDVVGDYAIRGMRLSDEIVDTDTPDKDEEKSDSKQTASSAKDSYDDAPDESAALPENQKQETVEQASSPEKNEQGSSATTEIGKPQISDIE